MKHHLIFLIALAMLFGSARSANAQKDKGKSKEEQKAQAALEKEWKKRLKETDPLVFRDMTNELNTLKKQTGALKKQIEAQEKDNTNVNGMVASKNFEVQAAEEKARKLQEDCDNNVTAAGSDYTKGVVFKVQVGAYRSIDLSKFQNKGNFFIEDDGGVKKYSIAHFRDYKDAKIFRNYLRQMGVKGAWIVVYEDDVRQPDIRKYVPEAEAD